MKSSALALLLCGCGLLVGSGCAGLGEYETDSPTLRLIRGEIHPDQFGDAVSETNERQRAQEAFEHNRVPTRAYNTRTGRFEFVPQDTVQSWNPQTERWEFTPPKDAHEQDPKRAPDHD